MPLFEFHCARCDADFEELVRSARESGSVSCPKCGGKDVGRKISVFAAKSAAAKPSPMPMGGGCGRCGDPQGPCGI